MIIVNIQNLPGVGHSDYVKTCTSNSTTYLNDTSYEIKVADAVDYSFYGYFCKGWDCPIPDNSFVTGSSANTKCGVSLNWSNITHLMRLADHVPSTVFYSTPCKNYENAYWVSRPDEPRGYIIGCPGGLELNTPSVTTNPATVSASTLESSSLLSITPSSSETVSQTTSNSLSTTSELSTSSSSSSLSQTTSSSVSSQTTPNAPMTTSESSAVSSSGVSQYAVSSSSTIATESPISTLSSSSAYYDKSSEEFSLPTLTIDPASSEVLPVESSVLETEVSSQIIQQSNEVINLGKAGAQLSAGAIVGIVFASIAGFTILTVLVGVAGFIFFNLASKKSATQDYSFQQPMREIQFK